MFPGYIVTVRKMEMVESGELFAVTNFLQTIQLSLINLILHGQSEYSLQVNKMMPAGT